MLMGRRWLSIMFVVVLFVFSLFVAGCGTQSNDPSLPTSAKQTAENQITIPFPYTDQFPSGTEQWVLDRDSLNHFVIKVLYRNKEIATFPLNAIGVNQVTGKITLGANEYSVTSITLNNDQTSGWVTLQAPKSLPILNSSKRPTADQPSSYDLPTSIQSVSISDDSPASIGWTPHNQKTILLQVSSWLNKATPYIYKIPQSQGPYVFHANIGPSELHILTSDKHQITIYPAYYIEKMGKTDTAISQDENGVVTTTENPEFQVHYVQDVLVFDNGGDRTYLKSEPLYNWLKQDQWKLEFGQG
jgi:hypothetical protein